MRVVKSQMWNDVIMETAGVFLMAVGTNMFYDPTSMVTGGVTGLAIILKGLTGGIISGGIPIWFTNIFLNILLFIGSYKILGKEFLRKTIFTTIMYSVALYAVPVLDVTQGDYLLTAIFGAAFSGVGIGLVFYVSSSTGGTDVLGAILHKHMRHRSIAQIIMVVDGMVVLLGALIYGLEVALYAAIAVYLTSKVMDAVLEGFKFAKMAYIVSDHYKEISDTIMSQMRRGVTGLQARGMYSNAEKQMLVCVVSQKEITILKDIVAQSDPHAFMIVTDAKEVLGEGFIEHK